MAKSIFYFHWNFDKDREGLLAHNGYYVAYLLRDYDVEPTSHWAVPGTLDVNS